MSVNKYLDFDKEEEVFFYNLYLNDYNYSIKIPISGACDEKHLNQMKIEHFNLSRYTFLLNCEQ